MSRLTIPVAEREWDYKGLKAYFAALRAAFDDLTVARAT
jgi:hypothetical protein